MQKLSKKETEIAELITNGLSNAEIATRLGISEKGVKFHNTNIFKKAQVSSRSAFIYKTLSLRIKELESELKDERAGSVYVTNHVEYIEKSDFTGT